MRLDLWLKKQLSITHYRLQIYLKISRDCNSVAKIWKNVIVCVKILDVFLEIIHIFSI